jgi:hypothetical protein
MTPEQERLVLEMLTKLADVQPVINPDYKDDESGTVFQCVFCGSSSRFGVIIHDNDCIVTLARKLKEMQ